MTPLALPMNLNCVCVCICNIAWHALLHANWGDWLAEACIAIYEGSRHAPSHT